MRQDCLANAVKKQHEKAVLKKQAKVGDIVSLKMDPQDVGNNM